MPYMESLGFDSSTTVHRSMSIPRQFMKAVPWSWVPNRPTDPPHHPGPTLDPPSLHCRADPPHDPLLIRAAPPNRAPAPMADAQGVPDGWNPEVRPTASNDRSDVLSARSSRGTRNDWTEKREGALARLNEVVL